VWQPNSRTTADVHGSPLGEEEPNCKGKARLRDKKFYIPKEALYHMRKAVPAAKKMICVGRPFSAGTSKVSRAFRKMVCFFQSGKLLRMESSSRYSNQLRPYWH